MALETTTITGTIYDANGVVATGGRLLIRLSHPGIARDTGNSKDELVAGEVIIAIASNGAVSFALVPNDVITPVGTTYVVRVQLPNGYAWQEHWSVASTPDPAEIGDILRVDAPSVDELVPDVAIVAALPPASAQWARRMLVEVVAGEQLLWVCLAQSGGSTYSWVLVAAGG